MEGID
jgi:hypothetical protein